MPVILKKYFSVFVCVVLFLPTLWSAPKEGVTFKKGTIKIKNITLKAEFAETDEEHQYGLMNRLEIPANFGMLFIFDREDDRSFWMKNTFVDLSIAYIGENKKILEILDMAASKSSTDNPISYPSQYKAKYALEVNKGWFKKNKIQVGDKITYSIKK